MLGATIIVFREVLEAALVITIVLAATRGVDRRLQWISGGVLTGVIGAVAVAGFANVITNAMQGIGQEVFNACILLAAVLMLAWHNIWMANHGQALAKQMTTLGKNISDGDRPLSLLAVAVGLAVLREGSEVVLFLNGIMAGGQSSSISLLGGSMLGLVAGSATGLGLYFGLLKVPVRHFFSVTSWMILLLSAGMAAGAAGYLEQAGLVPVISASAWDTSGILSENSLVGQLLHVLIGYYENPTGIQVVFYITVLVSVYSLSRIVGYRHRQPQPALN